MDQPGLEGPQVPEFGLKYDYRPYVCMTCGQEKMIGTNHTDICFDHCPGCSWRGGMHPTGEVYHPSHTRAFQFAGQEPEDKMIDRDLLGEADELLPRPPSMKVRDLQDKATQSRAKLAQLRAQMGNRPDVLAKIDDLDKKMNQRDSLLRQLKYSLEFREAAARHNVPLDQVRALIPHPSTPFGQTPRSVVGLVTNDGRRVMFTRPIDVHRPDVVEHWEDLDEGWRKWAAGAAMGAALLGAGIHSQHHAKAPQQASYVDPDAEREAKAEQRLRNKADQLKSAGKTSGTFKQGKLQPDTFQPGTLGGSNTAERRVSHTDF